MLQELSRSFKFFLSKLLKNNNKGSGLMANLTLQMYLSYSTISIFRSSLDVVFNEWSGRDYSQGFSWKDGSVSFLTMTGDCVHNIHVFLNEPIPEINENVIRAIKVPFEAIEGAIEVASISGSTPLEVEPGKYSLQIEFLQIKAGKVPEINIRLNRGISDFSILKADEELIVEGELDLMDLPVR